MVNIYSIRPKGFNIGNDVIYLALNHFIRQAFEKNLNLISLPATGKYETNRKAGLSSETIYEINQFGHGVIIGGGNLYENGELEIDNIALKALEKPLMIFSVSRGMIFNKQLKMVERTNVMSDEKISLLNRKADISLSRDKATFEFINNLGEKNILGGCPTLFINEIPQHLVPLSMSEKTDALISIRTPSLMSIPSSSQHKIRKDIIEIINLLKKKNYKNIKLLCHDHRDIPFADSFDIEYLYTEDVYTFLSYLRNTRLSITYRLHSFLPCLSFNIPTINLSYDQRSISMLDTLNIAKWNINILKENVLNEIEDRINRLDDLNLIKDDLKNNVWRDLKDNMVDACTKFSKLVEHKIQNE